MRYTIRSAPSAPSLRGLWDGPEWAAAETLSIAHYHPESQPPLPNVQARVLHDEAHFYVHFRVEEGYVSSVHTAPQSPVSSDSCVEMFIQPRRANGELAGYFNFEHNAGGAILLHYVMDPGHPDPHRGGRTWVNVSKEWLDRIPVYHNMPTVVEPPIDRPTVWHLEYSFPVALLEAYAGPLTRAGEPWRVNFYKCGPSRTGRWVRHWGAWSPIGAELNFHQPRYFSELAFEPVAAAAPSCGALAAAR